MIVKPCFMCGKSNIRYHAINNKKGYVYCVECLSRGVIFKCIGDSYEQAINKWNTRWFDTELLKRKNFYSNYINKLENDFPTPYNISVGQEIYAETGFFIGITGNIIKCPISHYATINELLGIELATGDVESLDQVCNSLNLVRITYINTYIHICSNFKLNDKQQDVLLRWLCENSWASVQINGKIVSKEDVIKELKCGH